MASAVHPTGAEPAPDPHPLPRRTTRIAADDGTELHVEEYGDVEAPVTVVLTHGYTLDRRSWRRQLSDLPAALGSPVRILAYDHRGHGRSDPVPREAATVVHLGDDLAAVLRACVPDGPVVLAGHSMGGMTIMSLAERHPRLFAERVAGVAFVSTSCGGLAELTFGLPRPVARLLRRLEGTGGHLRRRTATHPSARGGRRTPRTPTALLRLGVRWLLFGRAVVREHVDLIAASVAATPPDTVHGFRAALEDHERHAALSVCRTVPVVVLCGARDRLLPPSHSRVIADALPASRHVLCPDAGHMLPLERPDEVTRHLAALVRAAGKAQASGENARLAAPEPVDPAAMRPGGTSGAHDTEGAR